MSAEDVAALFGVTAAVVGNASSSARSAPSNELTRQPAGAMQIFSFCMASYPMPEFSRKILKLVAPGRDSNS